MNNNKTYGVWAVRGGASIFGHAEAWCKENGKPLEFATYDAAAAYADDAGSHTTSNVHYYVKEKEPEVGAIRKQAAQPDVGALSHSEVIPRNETVEKLNEIPGRQLGAEQDKMVAIRSAVHSNYAGMAAMLGADNRVYLGHKERCHDQEQQSMYYDNGDGSLCFVSERSDMYYFLYGEGWSHPQEEMLKRGLSMQQYQEFARLREGVLTQFTPDREILFAGQPFKAPESYLRNAELYMEGQRGNYNMLNGRIDNLPPQRPDLTDGQTYDEIRELVPETLMEEKPSLLKQLKAEQAECETRHTIPPEPERQR